jgi:hypothetical protein
MCKLWIRDTYGRFWLENLQRPLKRAGSNWQEVIYMDFKATERERGNGAVAAAKYGNGSDLRVWRYYATSSSNPLPTFRDNVSVPSSRAMKSKKTS